MRAILEFIDRFITALAGLSLLGGVAFCAALGILYIVNGGLDNYQGIVYYGAGLIVVVAVVVALITKE